MVASLITIGAWVLLIMTLGRLVWMLLNLRATTPPTMVARDVVTAVTGIFILFGLLGRENISIYAPLVAI